VKNFFPVFVENSRLPVILSKVSPIDIWAISLGLFVFCRGELSEEGKNHETIHFKQWVELLLLGFLILYPLFWIVGLIRYRNGARAYEMIPFEQEAYANDQDLDYLKDRKLYSWVKYVWSKEER
jgi:hypothetical protein